jgi:ectoine hydroxylase-related dioxygenase (phytanoyl-CoA dioxygenase family)
MRSLFGLSEKRPLVEVVLEAASKAALHPTSGLLVVELTLQAERATEARLQVFVGTAKTPVFEKRLRLDETSGDSWLALHGHLLPNGPTALRIELRDQSRQLLASRDLELQVRNTGELARQVADSLRRTGVPLVVDGVCDSADYDYADASLTAWFDRPAQEVDAYLQGLETDGRATAEEIAALRHFVDNGYLVMPDVVDAAHLARLNEALDDAVANKVEGYEWGSSQRLHNLHTRYPAIQELWLHPRILRMLSLVFDGPARPCQSLTYVFGSQQEHHQDTVHLTPFPAGRMCGVWTALEDVQTDSGELMVFPGSHRLPRVYMDSVGLPKVQEDWAPFQHQVVGRWTEFIERERLGRIPYRPKAGTVLIWHENLMHGGEPRKDLSKSRRSIVGHYFAQGSIVYFDSSGVPGAVYEGDLP